MTAAGGRPLSRKTLAPPPPPADTTPISYDLDSAKRYDVNSAANMSLAPCLGLTPDEVAAGAKEPVPACGRVCYFDARMKWYAFG